MSDILNWRPLRKAIAATALTLPPVLIRYGIDQNSQATAFVFYGLCVFLVSLLSSRSSDSFERVRDAALKRQLDDFFAEAKRDLKPNQRLPFRVYVFQPRWLWTRLATVYQYNDHTSDPDYGIWFWSWQGLCGRAYWQGQMGWFDCREHDPSDFHLNERERRATERLKACCCIPIRSAPQRGLDTVSPSVKAVISFDCIDEEYIDGLKELHDKLLANDRDFLDEIALISLYFT